MLYLQRPTTATNDRTGQVTETWSTVGAVWAAVTPKNVAESPLAGQQSAGTAHEVRCNYRNDINGRNRFLVDKASGQLDGTLDDSTVSVVVDDAAFVGHAQENRLRMLKIDGELMTVLGVSGTTITVVRGVYGDAAEHADDSRVILYRQMNIEGEPYDPDGRRRELMCECTEVN